MKLLGTILVLLHNTVCTSEHVKDIIKYLNGDSNEEDNKKILYSKQTSEVGDNSRSIIEDKLPKQGNLGVDSPRKTNKNASSNKDPRKNVSSKDKSITNRSTNSKEKGDLSTINQEKKSNSLLINNTRVSKETFMSIQFWFENERCVTDMGANRAESIKEFLYSLYDKVRQLLSNFNYFLFRMVYSFLNYWIIFA